MADGGPSCSSPNDPKTNKTVLNRNVVDLLEENKGELWTVAVEKYKEEFGLHPGVKDLHVHTKMKAVLKKSKTLRGEAKEKYLSKTFTRPVSMPDYVSNVKDDSPRKKKLRKELYESEKEKKTLKRKLDDSVEKINEMDLEFETLTDDYEKTIFSMAKLENEYGLMITKLLDSKADTYQKFKRELSLLQSGYDELNTKLAKTEQKLRKKPTLNARNLNKRLKTSDKNLKKAQDKIEVLEKKAETADKTEKTLKNTSEELDKTKQILKSKASEILKLKTEKIALQKKVSSEKKKVADAKELVNNIKLSVENDKREVDLKQKEVQIKEKELEYLESLLTDDKIQTFHDGKYMDHIRLTIMELLSMNVSINKVNDVIRTVIKRLTNKEIDKLPSKGLRCQF